MSDSNSVPESEAAVPADETVQQLVAERDALKAQLDRARHPRRSRVRSVVVGTLAILSCLFLLISTNVVWTHRTLLNTDTFVSTVGPVLQDRAVDTIIATKATDQLFTELDLQKVIASYLPKQVPSGVSGPISNYLEGVVSSALTKVLASHAFQSVWNQLLRTSHTEVVAVLRGQHSTIVSTQDGWIVLNTVPVINEALGDVSSLIYHFTGKKFTFPSITAVSVPQVAIDKLSSVLGVKLPSTFGQVRLIKSSSLSTAQRGVKAFDSLVWLLPLFTLLLVALCLWLSRARRRTILQLAGGTALLLIVERRVIIHLEGSVAASTQNPSVAHTVFNQVLHGLFDLTATILWIAVIVFVVALITGPYGWAKKGRAAVAKGGRAVAAQVTPERRRATFEWISAHAGALQVVGAVVAGILLLIVSVSWLSFLIIGGLLVAYEVALHIVKRDELAKEQVEAPAAGGELESAAPKANTDA